MTIRKSLLVFIVTCIFCMPFVAFAQSTTTPSALDQVITLQKQLIELLTKQVAMLLAQIEELKNTTNQSTSIAQTPAPLSFGTTTTQSSSPTTIGGILLGYGNVSTSCSAWTYTCGGSCSRVARGAAPQCSMFTSSNCTISVPICTAFFENDTEFITSGLNSSASRVSSASKASCKTGNGQTLSHGTVLDYCSVAHGVGINCMVVVNPKMVCDNGQWKNQ